MYNRQQQQHEKQGRKSSKVSISVARKHGGSMWAYRRKMESFGLRYCPKDRSYRGKISEKKLLRKIMRYCWWHGLKFGLEDEFSKRSSDYRQAFFRTHKPAFGNTYFCAYCGRPVSRKKITVDHLYPVAKVHASPGLQKKLKAMGAESVNDPINLVPACKRCNSRKGTRTGTWIITGRIGSHQKLWFLRWSLRFILAAAVLVIAFHSYEKVTGEQDFISDEKTTKDDDFRTDTFTP